MRLLSKYAIAASVVAVAVVGPASFYLLHDRAPSPGGSGGGLLSGQGFTDLAGERRGELRSGLGAAPPVQLSRSETDGSKTKVQVSAQVPKSTQPTTGASKKDGVRKVQTARVLSQDASVPKKERNKIVARLSGRDAERFQHQREQLAARPVAPRGAGNTGLFGLHAPQDLTVASRSDDRIQVQRQQFRDKFQSVTANPVKQVASEPVSTFSLDVDTASYAFVRRALNSGRLPPKAAVRVEEMINYFTYDYKTPEGADVPFKVEAKVVPAPWNEINRLVHLSIKGYALDSTERPNANLVFLVDVSGSMSSADKLPLVQNALRMLVNELKPDDTIGIVTYASGTAVALQPTKVKEKHKILSVINTLRSGGSTAGARGIQDAYRLAQANFDPEGVNRIVLATDGDFNVGITNREELKGYIERKRKSGIYLSILGFGQGNYNDSLMQTLAQNGNGTASYIDTLNEARKVLVEESSSTLFPIAKDVKVQVEFNPARIRSYRLIGYETRALKREDFNNDAVDAGEVGSGHTVTAIYEVTPVTAPKAVDDLRYQADKRAPAPTTVDPSAEFGFVKLRYKLPNEETSRLLTEAIAPEHEVASLAQASADTQFSIAVAAFGDLLRGAPHLKTYSFKEVAELAKRGRGQDRFGYRSEFINLVRLAELAQP